MQSLKLALVQFSRTTNAWKTNLNRMLECLKKLDLGVDVVALPEGWLGTVPMQPAHYGAIMQELSSHMPDHCLIASGAQYLKEGADIFCRGLFLSPSLSGPVAVEKLFPSQAVGERAFVTPGSALPVVLHRGIKVGMAVCVDLMYPEVVRSLALRGAELVLNPVNIPGARIPLWQHIGMTRASENTIFVAMINNTGAQYPDGRRIQGESFVAFPDGYKLHTLGSKAGLYYVDLDFDLIQKVRARWPYLADIQKRPALGQENRPLKGI